MSVLLGIAFVLCSVQLSSRGANRADDSLSWSPRGDATRTEKSEKSGSAVLSVAPAGSWISEAIPLEPGKPYEMRLELRHLPAMQFEPSSKAVVGPEFAVQDIPLDASEPVGPWQSHTVRFVVPNDQPGQVGKIVLGEYDLKGRVEYRNVQVFPVLTFSADSGGGSLGQGESITGTTYQFQAPYLDKNSRNLSRNLESFSAAFHDNRWRFLAPDYYVTYRHEISGKKQSKATLIVNLLRHVPTSWALEVEASTDGKAFRSLGGIREAGTHAIDIPAEMLPAQVVWVRLRNGAGDMSNPEFFQVTAYNYSAELDGAPSNIVGRTENIAVVEANPSLEVRSNPSASGSQVFAVSVRNVGQKTVEIEPQLAVARADAEPRVFSSKRQSLTAGEVANIAIPFGLNAAGKYRLEFSLGEKNQTLLSQSRDVSILEVSGYGALLASPDPGVALWTASSGWKVGRHRSVPETRSGALRVSLAGNESEATQLVVRPSRRLEGLMASAGELKSKSGKTLPPDAVEISRVGYVNVEFATDSMGGIGLWPDPLPPIRAGITVEPGENQPLWVRVKLPQGTDPGLYRGEIALKADGFDAKVPFEVEVFAFDLPDKTTARSLFGFDAAMAWRYHRAETEADKRIILDKYLQSFSDHRVSPYGSTDLDNFTYQFPVAGGVWEGRGRVTDPGSSPEPSSLEVIDNSDTENARATTVSFLPIKQGELALNFRHKSAGDGAGPEAILLFYDAAGNHLDGQNRRFRAGGSKEWAQFSESGIVIPPAAASAKLALEPIAWEPDGRGRGKAWFDDVSLKNGSGEELIPDGKFSSAARIGDNPQIRFDWSGFDEAMRKSKDHYHFNSFILGVPGLGSGTFYEKEMGSLNGFSQGSPEFTALFRAWCGTVREHLEKNGWLDQAVAYPFDEPAEKDYPFITGQLRLLKENFPGLRRMIPMNLIAAEDPLRVKEFSGLIDFWCPMTSSFDPEFARDRQAHGDIFTWYICSSPRAPYAGLFIDHPGTDLRVWMWQTWQNNVDGGLIWHSNYWTSKSAYPDAPQNPYQDPMSWVTGHGTGKGQKVPWGAGDGRLIYPPEACFEPGNDPVLDGPVSSMRWEAMRDGMEDFEYLVLLKKLLAAKGASLPESEQKSFAALLQVPSEISKNLTEFTQDPAPIEARRLKIAKAIEVLQTIK